MLTRNGTWRKDETLALLYFFFFTSSAPTGGKKKKIKNVPYVMTNKSPKTKHYFCRRLSNGFAQFQVSGHKDI